MRWRFPLACASYANTSLAGRTESQKSGDHTGMDFRHITPSSSNGALRLFLSLIRQ